MTEWTHWSYKLFTLSLPPGYPKDIFSFIYPKTKSFPTRPPTLEFTPTVFLSSLQKKPHYHSNWSQKTQRLVTTSKNSLSYTALKSTLSSLFLQHDFISCASSLSCELLEEPQMGVSGPILSLLQEACFWNTNFVVELPFLQRMS